MKKVTESQKINKVLSQVNESSSVKPLIDKLPYLFDRLHILSTVLENKTKTFRRNFENNEPDMNRDYYKQTLDDLESDLLLVVKVANLALPVVKELQKK